MKTALPGNLSFPQQWRRELLWSPVICLGWTLAIAGIFWLIAGAVPMGWPRFLLGAFILSCCIRLLILFVLPYAQPKFSTKPPVIGWIAQAITWGAFTAFAVVTTALAMIALRQLPAWAFWPFVSNVLPAVVPFTIASSFVISLIIRLRARLDQTELRLRERELAEARARSLAAEAQLAALAAQIHPHFLFNTLNSITALIQEDPQEAERTLQRLSALLRFSLDCSQQVTVSLAQELKIVRDYLAIEHVRFGERLRYEIIADAALDDCIVLPLSIQTLVENSVKYAIAPRRAGGTIRLETQGVNGALHVSVSDDGPGFVETDLMPGHGLHNLRERLAALFDGQAPLTIARHEPFTVVSFTVPQSAYASV